MVTSGPMQQNGPIDPRRLFSCGMNDWKRCYGATVRRIELLQEFMIHTEPSQTATRIRLLVSQRVSCETDATYAL